MRKRGGKGERERKDREERGMGGSVRGGKDKVEGEN